MRSNLLMSVHNSDGTIRGCLAYIRREVLMSRERDANMIKFLLWCILLVLCWPLAIVAIVLYPIVWLILLPFRLVGIAVGGRSGIGERDYFSYRRACCAAHAAA